MHIEKIYNQKIVDKNKKQVVAIIKLNRTVEHGTVLFVKSPMFEEFFKSDSNPIVVETHNLSGDLVEVRKNMLPRDSLYARNFDEIRNSLVNSNGDYSLGFLRCKGITDGIEFKIDGLHSHESLEGYKNNCTIMITAVYQEFIKPTSVNTTIQVIEDSV